MSVETREQLAHIEQGALSAEAAAHLGSAAVENYNQTEELLSLSQLQTNVLSLFSQGHTAKQIGRKLGVSSHGVKNAKKDLSEKFPSLPAGVNLAIQGGLLSVEHRSDLELTSQLSALDIGILHAYSIGGSTIKVAEISGSDYKTVNKHEADLFKKIKAWSRPHAVRRAYELGIFSVAEAEDK